MVTCHIVFTTEHGHVCQHCLEESNQVNIYKRNLQKSHLENNFLKLSLTVTCLRFSVL